MTLIRNNNRNQTNWYSKPTSSNRIINFSSNHPIMQKCAIVYTLTDNAILLSDPIFHDKNINKIKTILTTNNYPLEFINKYISNRIKNLKHIKKNKNKEKEKDIMHKKIKFLFHTQEKIFIITKEFLINIIFNLYLKSIIL